MTNFCVNCCLLQGKHFNLITLTIDVIVVIYNYTYTTSSLQMMYSDIAKIHCKIVLVTTGNLYYIPFGIFYSELGGKIGPERYFRHYIVIYVATT